MILRVPADKFQAVVDALAKQLGKDMPKTTFADVAGVDEAVE